MAGHSVASTKALPFSSAGHSITSVGDEQDDIREESPPRYRGGRARMAQSEQMTVDAKKVRVDVKAESERKLPKPDGERPKA
jgi:hypothetical protein